MYVGKTESLAPFDFSFFFLKSMVDALRVYCHTLGTHLYLYILSSIIGTYFSQSNDD